MAPTFEFPRPPRIGPGWYVLSAAINLGVLAFLVWMGYATPDEPPGESVVFIALAEPEIGPREIEMLFLRPQLVEGEGSAAIGQAPEARPLARSVAPFPSSPIELIPPPRRVPDAIPVGDPDSTSRAVAVGTRRILGPSFGDGFLWEVPDLTTEERTEIALQIARVDSLVRERILGMLAELPPDSFAFADNPEWMANIGGMDFGIDQQWITIAGIKLPTALLALLPMPQGNIFEARDAARYERIRQEIIETARRQEDREDIKRYIEEMRERRDAEREAARRARAVVASGDSTARRDSIPR